MESIVYLFNNIVLAKILVLHSSTQVSKYYLKRLVNFVKSIARLLYWFLAPNVVFSIMKRHTVMFLLCCFVYPILQRWVISPIFRKLNYASCYALWGTKFV